MPGAFCGFSPNGDDPPGRGQQVCRVAIILSTLRPSQVGTEPSNHPRVGHILAASTRRGPERRPPDFILLLSLLLSYDFVILLPYDYDYSDYSDYSFSRERGGPSRAAETPPYNIAKNTKALGISKIKPPGNGSRLGAPKVS